jgi:hypothetical protein
VRLRASGLRPDDGEDVMFGMVAMVTRENMVYGYLCVRACISIFN